ncbi:MAG: LytTR family DNA-binding domain-containing protein [Pseudomonadota bacterium]
MPLYEARVGSQSCVMIVAHSSSAELGKAVRKAFWRKTLSDLGIMTVIGVFLAIIGPFGSIHEPLPIRLMGWLVFAYLGYAIYAPMGFFVNRTSSALDLPRLPLWFFACLVASAPMTVLVYFVQSLPRWPAAPSLEEALTSYFYVFVIGGGITLLFNVIGATRSGAEDARLAASGLEAAEPQPGPVSAALDANPAPNALLDALPAELGSDVIALEMEDHYVRVHTALGSELVLMRLRDAMAHLSGSEGRQVHRSWWVARGAVEDIRREGRNVRLVLARGIEAPVSRAQVSELKEAGWI